MPQKKRKSVDELLGIAPQRKSVEEILGIAPRPASAQVPAPEAPGFLENVQNAAESGYRKYLEPSLMSLGEVTEGMKVGNFAPLASMAESTARGIFEGVRPPQPLQVTKDPVTGQMVDAKMAPPRDTRITTLQKQRDARYQASPSGQYSRERLAELDARAAADPSITGKVTRGATELLTGAAPTLAAAILSRGSLPVVSLAAAAQSANNPSAIGANVALNTLPLPAVAPILRRIRGGRGAAVEGAPVAVENARTTATFEPFPNAPTTSPLPRTVLERAETEALTETLPPRTAAPAPPAPASQYGFQEAFSNIGIGDNLKKALRDSVAKNGKLPGPERNSSIGKAFETAVANGEPRNVDTLNRVLQAAEQGVTPARTAAQAVAPEGRIVTVGDKQYTLTPEQEARWIAEVDEPLEYAKRHADDLKRLQGQQEAGKYRRGAAMRVAATKREIVDALTDNERAAIAKRESSNYKGKPVLVEINGQQVSGTVEGLTFGRIRVKLEDGQTVTVERGQIAPSTVAAPSGTGSTLETAFAKLGTDDPGQISVMIANANRRFTKKRGGHYATPGQIQSSLDDYARISKLTGDEQRALGEVLPPYKFDPVQEGTQVKGDYGREVNDIPLNEPNAQLDANLRELDDFFTNQAQVAQKPTSPFLHQVVGNSADDLAMVNVADMGIETATVPSRPAGAKAVRRNVLVDDITLGRDNLSKGRMFQVQEALKNGVQPEKRGVPLRQQVDPITVVPDPANPGKWIVEDDGNHRVGFLKLLGYTDEIPVKSFETPAQTTAISARSASVSGPKVGETAALNVGGGGGGTGGPGGSGAGGGANPAQIATAAERTPILQVISALRKAGLLTGVKTHLKNLGGNTAFQISEELTRIPGALVDMTISLGTKRRTFTGPSFGAVARSAGEAATKGLQEAKEIIRKGGTAADMAKEFKPVNSGSKVLDTYINGTFRLLNAEDRVFRVYGMRRALEERAKATALTEIRQGTIPRGDYGKRVQEILKSPPEDLAAAAAADVEMAVFANDNLVSQGREAVRGVLQRKAVGRGADFAIDQIFPFVKTPTNVIARMLDYAGVTVPYRVVKAIVKRSFTEAEQRAFAQSFGRASVGAGIIALGVKGYQDGWLTGLLEDDPTRRARDAAAGRIPGAIKVGDTWHQITGFAPLASLLAIGATLARETDQEREGTGVLPALEVAGDALMEQPLLSGTKQILEGIQQPGSTGARALGGLAGSFVPTAVSDIGELADPTQRQASTIAQRVQQRIPGLRESLPERRDVLGRPTEDRATQIIDPTRSTTDAATSDPLFRELVRLDAGISGFRKAANETDEQSGAKAQRFGQLYSQYGQRLVSSAAYAKASDAQKLRALKVLNDRSKDLVTKGRERIAPNVLSAPFLLDAARRSAQNAARKNAR